MRRSILPKIASHFLGIAALAVAPAFVFAQTPPGSDPAGLTILTMGKNSGVLTGFQAPTYEVQTDPAQKKMHGAPKIGEATAVFNISQAGELLRWVSGAWDGGPAAMDGSVRVAGLDYNIQRGIDMTACTLTSIEFSELKASGKKHLEATAKFQPDALRFVGPGGQVRPPAPAGQPDMLPENFTVTMPGIRDEWVVSIGLPKVTPKLAKESHGKAAPTPVYDKPDLGTLTIEIAPDGIPAASDFAMKILQDGNCEESEFVDIIIDMKDQSLKKVLGEFTLVGCGLKKFDWAPKLEGGKEGLATATLEFAVEDFRFTVKK